MMSAWAEETDRLVKNFASDVSIALIDLKSGEEYRSRDEICMKSASLIKMPLLWELFAQAESGETDLNERLRVSLSEKKDGGLLHKSIGEPELRLCDLALLTGAISDNTAANLLMERLGFDSVNKRALSLGMTRTSLQRKMLDAEAKKAGKENYSCAADIALFFRRLIFADGLSEKSASAILNILSAQKLQCKFAAKIPCDDVDDLEMILAHKTGELPGHEHDAGVFFYNGRSPVIAAVMTQNLKDRLDGVRLCADVGRIIYDSFIQKQ